MADDPTWMRCDMLGLLPLALNLAAAELRDTDASIADYMADLKELEALIATLRKRNCRWRITTLPA